ncbi:MAG TPA: hypothetical protein C5S37_02430 [Methanophagales archaeon]|nr:hypothetical protein [Methanophagales archaeon]
MDADIENEINKKRWKRWRRKQNREREKTYCYWGNWNNWDNWNNWSNWSDCQDRKPYKATIFRPANEYCYSITPNGMAVESGETYLIYITAHLGYGIPLESWIEIGAKRDLGLSEPLMFAYGVIDGNKIVDETYPQYPWDWGEKREFKLRIDKETGNYELKWFNPGTGKWEFLVPPGSGFPENESYRGDMFGEYFSCSNTSPPPFTEYFERDVVEDGLLDGESFDSFLWNASNKAPGQVHPILNGAEFWVEYG